MSKTKRGPRPVSSKGYTPPPSSSSSWAWWAAGGAVVVLGALIIILAKSGGGSSPSGAGKPEGVESATYKDTQHVALGQAKWDRVPPMGGQHFATAQNCGIYEQPIVSDYAVHSLEHGAVWITYDPSLAADQVPILRQVVQSKYKGQDRRLLLSPFPGLPSPVVATVWGNQLKLQSATDPRLPEFIDYFLAHPSAPEPGGPCQGNGEPVG